MQELRYGRVLRCIALLMLVLAMVMPSAALAAKATPTPQPTDGYDADSPELLTDDQLRGDSCIVIDASTGRVLYEKAADKKRYPASTTKIMTLLLALENGDPDKTVTVAKAAGSVPDDSTKMPVKVGDKLKLRDLMYGLILKSGNDAANAIAVEIGGSTKSFAAMMNKRATELGMTDTHYVNAHGYHNKEHYTTARDMSILARYCMQNQAFRDIVSTISYTAPPSAKRKEKLTMKTSIALMNPENKYYLEGTIGIKTGTHSDAGHCFVGGVKRGETELITVTMKSTEASRWRDTIRLTNYALTQYETYTLGQLYQRLPIKVNIDNADPGDAYAGLLQLDLASDGEQAFSLNLLDDQVDVAAMQLLQNAQVDYARSLTAPIQQGEFMGTLHITQPDGISREISLLASRDVNEPPSMFPFLGDTEGVDIDPDSPIALPNEGLVAEQPDPIQSGLAPQNQLMPRLMLAMLVLILLLVLFVVLRMRAKRSRKRRSPQKRTSSPSAPRGAQRSSRSANAPHHASARPQGSQHSNASQSRTRIPPRRPNIAQRH